MSVGKATLRSVLTRSTWGTTRSRDGPQRVRASGIGIDIGIGTLAWARVWGVECGVWSVGCGVWGVECGVWSVGCVDLCCCSWAVYHQ